MPGFLTHRLAGAVAGSLAVLLAIALAWVTIDKNATIRGLDRQINHPVTGLAPRLKAAERDLAQCRANRITLEEATRRQNAAVAAAKAEGDRRVAELDRVAVQARRDAAAAGARAQAIMARRGTGDHCADADALILEEVQ